MPSMPVGRLVPRELFAKMLHDLERIARMYRAVTRQIEVTVEPNFLPERSSVENRQYFWSYTIVITNTGEETVQLRTRHWIITDAALRIHQRRPASDRVRLHDWPLPDG
jgi:ApaG protein